MKYEILEKYLNENDYSDDVKNIVLEHTKELTERLEDEEWI